MISEKQLGANRRNALKSTGPRTPEGKAKDASNALKRGLLSKDIIVPGEEFTELEQFRDALMAQLAPEGELECLLADRQQRLRSRHFPSPVAVGDRIYFCNNQGVTSVVACERRFRRLAENDLAEKTFPSFAPVDGDVYVRAQGHLYCLREG